MTIIYEPYYNTKQELNTATNGLRANPFRREQYLPQLTGKRIPKRFIFFDTETIPVIRDNNSFYQQLKFGIATYVELDIHCNIIKDETTIFYSTDEFYAILLKYDKPKKKLIIFAHNIKFDIEVLNLPKYLTLRGHKIQNPIVNGMVFIWKVKLNKGSFHFLDTANYCGVSLKQIGNDIGIPKLEIDFNTVSEDDFIEYAKNDVIIIKEFIHRFIKFLYDNELGSFKYTLASQAMTAYRHRFMSVKPYTSLRPESYLIERDSYYGGRTETHFIGNIKNETLYNLDINSAYPFSMINDTLPIKFRYDRINPTLKGFEINMRDNYVIARVTLNTMKNAFPYKYNKRLLFPIGTFETTLHHHELLYAMEHNLIDNVGYYCAYEKGSLFNDYVSFFHNMKQISTENNNQTNRLISKIFLNSLYGKFGQSWKHTKWIKKINSAKCYILPISDRTKKRDYIELCWYGDIYHIYNDGIDVYTIKSISGAITALTRMNLFNYMETALLENVYYNDTDSIIVNDKGYNNLSASIKDELGMLKLEEIINDVTFYGAKDYIKNGKVIIKGVPKSAIEIKKDVFQFEQFEGFKQWRNRGGIGSPITKRVMKVLERTYSKGVVMADGNVYPHVFDNGKLISYQYYLDHSLDLKHVL